MRFAIRAALATLVAALTSTLATNAAAADTAPPPVVAAQKQALSAQGLGLKSTLAVERIKISILQGEELGGVTGGWVCAFRKPNIASEDFLKNYGGIVASIATQELKRLGYPLARAGQASAFDVDVAAAPDSASAAS